MYRKIACKLKAFTKISKNNQFGEFSNLKHFFCSGMMRCCYYIILMNIKPTWYCPITSDFLILIFNHFTFEHRRNTVPTRPNLSERRPNPGLFSVTVQGLLRVCYGGPRTDL